MKSELEVAVVVSVALALSLGLAGCGDDDGSTEDPGPKIKDVRVVLTNDAASPLAPGMGELAFSSGDRILVATASGISEFSLSSTPATERGSWTLTSTGSGPASSGIAVAPYAVAGSPRAFFLPTGSGQVGSLELGEERKPAVEDGLAQPLSTPFPTAIVAPKEGSSSDALWVVDAPFGPGGAVRPYPYARMSAAGGLVEDAGRSFSPKAQDLDGDGEDDVPILGKLVFARNGDLGLVAFTFFGKPGLAGGVFAFDPQSGEELGHVVVPNADTSTSTLGFVTAVAVSGDRLLVAAAEKTPDYMELSGQVSIYSVSSWRPFAVLDAEPSLPGDQPTHRVETSIPNPVGLAAIGPVALVVDAPFFAEGALDELVLDASPRIRASHPLGQLYTAGFAIPGDPHLDDGRKLALIGTEAGVIRAELTVELEAEEAP